MEDQAQNEQLHMALHQYFGFTQFRRGQIEIIKTIMEGKPCLAILPTGGGKSLCFQLPGLLLPGLTVVISPLISLMTDQVQHLQQKNIPAGCYHSQLSEAEKTKLTEQLQTRVLKFLYLSPESLQGEFFAKQSASLNISLLVVDEAHCISEWGHQFRPEYTQIDRWLATLMSRPRVAAFTASATQHTELDILRQLQMTQPTVFRQSVERPNLALHVTNCQTSTHQYLAVLRLLAAHREQATLIYCATRKKTEQMAQLLGKLGLQAAAYHGGQSAEQRAQTQQQFLEGGLQLICATTAFGMGVDKPDIRCIIHLNLPISVEGYYQEIGRAGRDGLTSQCYLLTLPSDTHLQENIILGGYLPFDISHQVIQAMLLHRVSRHTFADLLSFSCINPKKVKWQFRDVLDGGEERGWWTVDWTAQTLHLTLPIVEVARAERTLRTQALFQLKKFRQMQSFASARDCRMTQLIHYFEPHHQPHRCGQCDVCTQVIAGQPTAAEQRMFRRLLQLTRLHCRIPWLEPDGPLRELTVHLLANAGVHTPAAQHVLGIGRGWKETYGKQIEWGQPMH